MRRTSCSREAGLVRVEVGLGRDLGAEARRVEEGDLARGGAAGGDRAPRTPRASAPPGATTPIPVTRRLSASLGVDVSDVGTRSQGPEVEDDERFLVALVDGGGAASLIGT